ncbi:MAG: hypothetical protein LBP85_08300 [Prevotellaceae bacterium]|jgi:hypothetical protein|nr:hypothetical protein [Prevotellaceae bacterium]
MNAIKIILLIAITLYSTGIYAQETQKKQAGNKIVIIDTTDLPPTLPDYYTGKDNKILSVDNQQYLIQSRQLGGYEFGNIKCTGNSEKTRWQANNRYNRPAANVA